MAEAARPRKRQGKARGRGTDNFCFKAVSSRGSSIKDYITTNISMLKRLLLKSITGYRQISCLFHLKPISCPIVLYSADYHNCPNALTLIISMLCLGHTYTTQSYISRYKNPFIFTFEHLLADCSVYSQACQ